MRWLVLLLALTFIIVVEAVAWLTFSCCRWQRCAGLTFGTVASIAWDPMATAFIVFPSPTHPLLSSMWSPVVPSTCSKLDCPVLFLQCLSSWDAPVFAAALLSARRLDVHIRCCLLWPGKPSLVVVSNVVRVRTCGSGGFNGVGSFGE